MHVHSIIIIIIIYILLNWLTAVRSSGLEEAKVVLLRESECGRELEILSVVSNLGRHNVINHVAVEIRESDPVLKRDLSAAQLKLNLS